MSSGFKSGSLAHLKYYGDPIELPSLHIWGETDDIIPKDMSESLAEAFQDPEIVIHPGKHYFPASAAQKRDYQSFLEHFYNHKQLEL